MTLFDSLMTRALEVLNEKFKKRNTSVRIGSLLRDILSYFKGLIDNLSVGIKYKRPVETVADLPLEFPNAKTGWTSLVKTGVPGYPNGVYYQFDEVGQWSNTGLVGIPSDVATKGGSVLTMQDMDDKKANSEEVITLTSKFPILKSDLATSVIQWVEAAGGGTITNFPDEEDVTISEENKLSFRNKAYSPVSYSGLGRSSLRKNILSGKNVLTQDMLSNENTTYHIQYDHDLLAATIKIPNGCVLAFEGGSLKNGTIDFNNCRLQGTPILDVEVKGSVANDSISATIFVNDTNDIGISINKAAKICGAVTLPSGNFNAYTTINFQGNSFYGAGSDRTSLKKGTIIYTSIEGSAIRMFNSIIGEFRIENILPSKACGGIEFINQGHCANVYVVNFYDFGVATDPKGIYYSTLDSIFIDIKKDAPLEGENGLYIRGDGVPNSGQLGSNNNKFTSVSINGGYKCNLNIQGNNNLILGGDFSFNKAGSENISVKVGGNANVILCPYIENGVKYGKTAVEIGENAEGNILHLFGPDISKASLINLSTRYNKIELVSYHQIFASEKYQYAKNFFDIPMAVKNNMLLNSRYIHTYFGGHGKSSPTATYSILSEKFCGQKILRISYNNSTKEDLGFDLSNLLKEHVDRLAFRQIFFKCYVRASFTSPTYPAIKIGYNNGDRYNYEVGAWQLLIDSAKAVNPRSFLHLTGADLYTGYIDIAMPFVGFHDFTHSDKYPHIIDDDITLFDSAGNSTILNYAKIDAINKANTTANRPVLTANDKGYQYYDTTLNKPIWWTGSKWVDSAGVEIPAVKT